MWSEYNIDQMPQEPQLGNAKFQDARIRHKRKIEWNKQIPYHVSNNL